MGEIGREVLWSGKIIFKKWYEKIYTFLKNVITNLKTFHYKYTGIHVQVVNNFYLRTQEGEAGRFL